MATKMKTLSWLLAGLLASGAAQAALHDRGGGLVYDDVLNVTWLGDANYAKTSGYDADGMMDWNAARSWADNLVFHDSARNIDFNGWRLASNSPVNGSYWDYAFWATTEPTDGAYDRGYNIISPHSELSYMYYVNLGLKGYFSVDGTYQPDSGVKGNGTYGGPKDVGLVKNLMSNAYWSGTADERNPYLLAWYFDTGRGSQYLSNQSNEFYAWAVRPGDVAAAVPEPESYAMLLAGLGLVSVAARRRRNFSVS